MCVFCENECFICLETINEPNAEILLKCDCSKNYHKSCLQKWIDERNCCPICKMVVINKQNRTLIIYQCQNEYFERICLFLYCNIFNVLVIIYVFYYILMFLIYGWSMG